MPYFDAVGIDLPKAATYSRPFDGRKINFGKAEAGKYSCWWEEFWSLLYMIGTCLDLSALTLLSMGKDSLTPGLMEFNSILDLQG